jgi:hypothetical protein
MDCGIRISAVRRDNIDIDKLAAAVLRLARDQATKGKAAEKPKPQIKRAS